MAENAYFLGTENHTETSDNATKQRIMSQDGYIVGVGSELAVIEHTPADMIVIVGTGEAWARGVRYENTAAKDIAIGAADATNPRIDRIVARLTWSTDTFEVVCLAGTAAASPTAPALTQSASVWELSLAQVAVAAGATTILTANITDERLTQYCGPAGVRMGFQHNNTDGTFDFGSKKGENLATPTAATDAANKSYVDGLSTPSGIIAAWSGAISAIPTGWVFCNGSSSTPDLRGKFILGAQSDSGGTYDVGDTGGEATHLLTGAESGIAEHSHVESGNHNDTGALLGAPKATGAMAASSTAVTGPTNAAEAHNNMPPYYVLAFVMKV